MTGAMIAAQGLEKSYGGHAVLRGVDLTVRRGEIFALLGPNGAGKTTTVNILTTLVRPDGGTARVAGADVVHDAARVRETIALTGQYASVDEFQTGRENLVMMGELAHLPRRAVRPRAAALLERFDLTDAADRRVATYSGGMRRRLDLAISLVADPAVLVLDEPTTGLDPASRAQLWEVVRGLAADGTTVLLTTTSTWRRPTAWPTRSPSCTTAASRRAARPPSSRRSSRATTCTSRSTTRRAWPPPSRSPPRSGWPARRPTRRTSRSPRRATTRPHGPRRARGRRRPRARGRGGQRRPAHARRRVPRPDPEGGRPMSAAPTTTLSRPSRTAPPRVRRTPPPPRATSGRWSGARRAASSAASTASSRPSRCP